jgi:ubiquinone/menaquinone biosynthesis C-methylase UbiE
MGFYAERVFPWMLDQALGAPAVAELTRQALAPLRGDILEVGFGSGRTLPLYPAGVASLRAAEPCAGMTRRAAERIAKAPFPVQVDLLEGERLPYPDARFDGVAMVLVLCTIPDPQLAIAQAWRVLKPGGLVAFLEHGLSPRPSPAKWQNRLNPVQRVVGCGCNLNRDPVAMLRARGFAVTADGPRERPEFPGPSALFPITLGVARKPG